MKATLVQSRYAEVSENARLILRYGMIVAATFAIIFLLAKLFGVEDETELRFINYLLLFPIVYTALNRYYKSHDHKIEYFTGFSIAILISILGGLIYSILFFIYLKIDQAFLNYLLSMFPRKILYPELSVAFINFSETAAMSVIVALALMQYFKRKRGRWARGH